MKLNRKPILVLALVLSVAMATTGTLAYLTDRDSAANVFTMGNVSIKLNEKYTQNSELLPGKEIQKEVTVTNTGTTDAWVWMSLAMPDALDDPSVASLNHIHWNVPGVFWTKLQDETKYKETGIEAGYITNDEWPVKIEKTWDVSNAKDYKTTIDGISYQVYDIWYYGVLSAGETTNIGLSDVYLDKHIDIDPEGNLYRVENGVVTPIEWNINTQGNPKIYVSAYAIQATGFDTAKDAYDAYHAQWGTEDGQNNGAEWAKVVTNITTIEQLIAALPDGAMFVLPRTDGEMIYEPTGDIDVKANGSTVVLDGDLEKDGYLGFVASKVNISDLNVTGSGFVELGHHKKGNGTYTATNLVLKDLVSTVGFENSSSLREDIVGLGFESLGNATLNNCIMTGTTAIKPNATAYDAGFPNDTTTTINGGEYGKIYLWRRATVTIKDAEIDQIDSCAAGDAMLTIDAGTHVKTINVMPLLTTDTPQLTIKEGATVDEIIYNDVTFTSESWPEWVKN